jgi:hypothetical protein
MNFCITLENNKTTLVVEYDKGKHASNYKIRQEQIVALFEEKYLIEVEEIKTYGTLTNERKNVTLEIVLSNSTINKLKKTTCELKDLRSKTKKETKKSSPLKTQPKSPPKSTLVTPSSKRGKNVPTDTN